MNPNLLYLLPILMLASYYLAILQYKKRKEIYSQYYDFDTISLLNPSTAEQINKGRISKGYLVRIIILTILVAFIATTFDPTSLFEKTALEFLIGLGFIIYAVTIARLVGNLALYHYLAKNPNQISGKIHLKTSLVMFQSIMEFSAFLVVIAMWVILSPSVFAYGALTGMIILTAQFTRYYYKSKKTQPTSINKI